MQCYLRPDSNHWMLLGIDLYCRLTDDWILELQCSKEVKTFQCEPQGDASAVDIVIMSPEKRYEIEGRVCGEGYLLAVSTIRRPTLEDIEELTTYLINENRKRSSYYIGIPSLKKTGRVKVRSVNSLLKSVKL